MTILVGLIIGLVLGLTGAGGSIFAVPLFILLLDLSINDAMGVSLGAVSVAALVGVLLRNNQRDLAWQPGLILATAGMATAPVGRWLGAQTEELVLLAGFSLLATTLAVRMWKQASENQKATYNLRASVTLSAAKNTTPPKQYIQKPVYLIFAGLLCGLLSGLFGVGGGFIIVPLLTLYAGMDIKQAVGTSLFVIALVSAAGFAFHLLEVASVPTDMLLHTSIGSILGILLGTLIAKRLAGPKLQKLFAFSVISLMALIVSRTII